jgi:hypothetical protein
LPLAEEALPSVFVFTFLTLTLLTLQCVHMSMKTPPPTIWPCVFWNVCWPPASADAR